MEILAKEAHGKTSSLSIYTIDLDQPGLPPISLTMHSRNYSELTTWALGKGRVQNEVAFDSRCLL